MPNLEDRSAQNIHSLRDLKTPRHVTPGIFEGTFVSAAKGASAHWFRLGNQSETRVAHMLISSSKILLQTSNS